MKSIIPKPLWLVPLAALALFGAGCFSSAPEAPSPTQPTPTPTAAPTPAPRDVAPVGDVSIPADEVPADEPAMPSIVDLPEVDDTWQTYTNKAETFSFQWPTKGRLAPTWEMSLPSKLEDGCYLSPDFETPLATKRLKVGDQSFCHTSYMDAAVSIRYFTDYYAANVNGQNVLIRFQKELVVGEVIGDGTCTGLVLRGSTEASCLRVDPVDYGAQLDQIMNTFKTLE
jgi:hypothetical protein